jgi:hypothetical protein
MPDIYHDVSLYSDDEELPLPVCEATLVLRVLMEADTPVEAETLIRAQDLSGIAYQIDKGDWLGHMTAVRTRVVPPEELDPLQKSMSSDGSFFPCPAGAPVDPAGKILRAQISQGWDASSLGLLQSRFIEAMGLQDSFAAYLEEVVRFETESPLDLEEDDEDLEP